jgi:hypothetical protein
MIVSACGRVELEVEQQPVAHRRDHEAERDRGVARERGERGRICGWARRRWGRGGGGGRAGGE